MDLNFDMAQHAPAVKPAVKHVAHAAPHVVTIVKQGYSLMTAVLVGAGSFIVGGIAGYFIAKRGWSGVQIDINNIKTDIENLKAKISGTSTTATPTATAA